MNPRYVSTRGGGAPVSFREALLQGLAPDGGLFVPTRIPSLPEGWRDAETLPEMGTRILAPWLAEEVGAARLGGIVEDALAFPIPLVPLSGEWDGVHILELFHGPTLSFKDVGARTMGRLFAWALDGEEVTILAATSGDTGSAVADGFAGVPGVRVVLLFPEGQVSEVQRRQLVAQRENVRTLAVRGTFDDCQRLVKAVFADPQGARLSSANSINIGRLLPQMLYYSWGLRAMETPPVVIVPSGNLGNLTAGMLATEAGLPVRRFIAAHNANAGFARFLGGGDVPAGDSVRTLSNAMDVGVPSNLERLRHLHSDEALRQRIAGEWAPDDDTLRTMREVFDATGYVADPHTAVGLTAARRESARLGTPVVVLATAHPAKFPEAVHRAIGQEPETPPRLAALMDAPERFETVTPEVRALRDALRR
ncbi:MAG: threonine synthase [Bacteroidota bacterium]